MKIAFATVMLLAVSSSAFAAPNSAPNKLVLNCTPTAEDGTPRSIFAPGESIFVDVYLNVPSHRTGNKMKLSFGVEGKVLGFNLGGGVSDVFILIPNRAVRETELGVNPGSEDRYAEGVEVRRHQHIIELGDNFPNSKLRIKMTATFADDTPIEANAQCDRTVKVRKST